MGPDLGVGAQCSLWMQEVDLPYTGGISRESLGLIWWGGAHKVQRLSVLSSPRPQAVQELVRLSLSVIHICRHFCHCQPWGWQRKPYLVLGGYTNLGGCSLLTPPPGAYLW